jgi:translation initiation factor 3 subunit E
LQSDLSARLNLSPDEGEKWIVNLIRDTRMAADAKIDLEKVFFYPLFLFMLPFLDQQFFLQNVIEIHRPALPIYQSVIEKTRGLSIRTQALGAALSRTGQQQQQAQPAPEQSAVVEGAR